MTEATSRTQEDKPDDRPPQWDDAALSLARYAEILAHLLHFSREDRTEVLARLGVREQHWNRADPQWRTALAAEVAREEATLMTEFGGAFGPVRTRLRQERPTIETLGPIPNWMAPTQAARAEAKPEPEAAESRVTEAESVSVTALRDMEGAKAAGEAPATAPERVLAPHVPSYLKAPVARAESLLAAPPQPGPPPPAATPPSSMPFSAETGAIDLSQLFKPSVPFRPGSPPSASVAPARAQAAAPDGSPEPRDPTSTETTDLDVSALLKSAVPFDSPPSAPDPAAPTRTQPATPQREPLSTETGAIDLGELFKPAVPFDPAAQSKLASTTPAPKTPAPRYESTETMELDLKALLSEAPVPFQKAPPKPETTALPAAGPPVFAPRVMAPAASPPSPAKPPSTTPPAGMPQGSSSRGRLIRFDPQTGAPLAVPYWQELPSTEEKK